MASLRVYQNQSHNSGGGDGAVEMRGPRFNLGAWEEIPLDEQRIELCIACSVVPKMDTLVACAVHDTLSAKTLFVKKDIDIPMENKYEHPSEVGADRIVATYAARQDKEQQVVLFGGRRSPKAITY